MCGGIESGSNCAANPALYASYSEEDPPPDNQLAKFKWRLDPEETFSDWTIEILVEKEEDASANSIQTYHVHKCILASGNRKSDYFARMFRNAGKYKESMDCTSRIELDPLAATCFPYLLDYIYAPEVPLQITTETATALHYLGEYFEIRHLRWDAKEFIQIDVSLDNADTYYQHATQFQNEGILGILAQFLGQNINEVSPSSQIVNKTNPDLWIKTSNSVDPASSGHWSQVVTEVGTSQFEHPCMNSTAFERLTCAHKMPQVHPEAALALCGLEDRMQKAFDSAENMDLTSLQDRCASAIAQIWKDWEISDEVENLKLRKASFLVDLLVKCLRNAKEALEKSEKASKKYRKSAQAFAEKYMQANNVIRQFQPLETGYLCGGSLLIPEDMVEQNPSLTGRYCKLQNTNHPVFYFVTSPCF